MILCLRQESTRPDRERSVATTDETRREEQRRRWVCRRCGGEITDDAAMFGKDSDNPMRIFSNPYGLLREIFTARRASGLSFAGPPTTEFTWFSGYAWEVAYCIGCNNHVGWRFSAVGDTEPRTFFGLLCSEVVEEESDPGN